LYPENKFRLKWELLITLLLIITLIITPYKVGFGISSEFLDMFDIFVDCAFFLDMILNFKFAHYDDNMDIVDNPWKIAKEYLGSWFIVDLIAVLPFSLLMRIF
jgi:hypothetical protein